MTLARTLPPLILALFLMSCEAGPITKVTVLPGAACQPTCNRAITNSTNFVDVPGASVPITVGNRSIIISRFSSDSFCAAAYTIGNTVTPGFCSVIILASTGPGNSFVEMNPQTSGFEEFQGNQGRGAHAIERSAGPVPPGTYTVKVQFRIFVSPPSALPTNTFNLTAWHLTAEAAEPLPRS